MFECKTAHRALNQQPALLCAILAVGAPRSEQALPRLGGLDWVLGRWRDLNPDCLWEAALMELTGCAIFNQNILWSGFCL